MFHLSRFSFASVGLLLAITSAGCYSQHRPELVPPTARLQMSGEGRELYTAPSDGMVYIYDKPADRLVWSGQVMRGQTVAVDRDKDQVLVNSAIVVNTIPVKRGRPIEIYFEPQPYIERSAVESGARIGGTSVNTTNGATVTTPGSVTVTPPPVTVTPSVTVEPHEPPPPTPRP